MKPDRLTHAAQQVLASAQSSAMSAGHPEVGSLHVLAAMLEDEAGAVSSVLERAGVQPQRLGQVVQAELKSLPTTTSGPGQSGREMMSLLQKADAKAKAMGDAYVATEHLLMACAQEGAARRVCEAVGLTPKAIEQAVEQVRKASGVEHVTDPNAETNYEALKKYAVDLTEKAQQGKIDPVIGRDEEIRRVHAGAQPADEEQPGAHRRAGVGKTAIVEGLARASSTATCPEGLRRQADHGA
ncbi:MAG: hypothetical protein KatS3mg103_1191 [Phycisphaerales bacterium]|nr:MAG: hypothetical protein KatS3mg103_1191 [Phycisphaerales bacterium]